MASDALLLVSELAVLTVANIDMTEQTITARRSKTDQEGDWGGASHAQGITPCNLNTYPLREA